MIFIGLFHGLYCSSVHQFLFQFFSKKLAFYFLDVVHYYPNECKLNFACLSIYLVCLSVCLSVYLSICLSIYLSTCIYLRRRLHFHIFTCGENFRQMYFKLKYSALFLFGDRASLISHSRRVFALHIDVRRLRNNCCVRQNVTC